MDNLDTDRFRRARLARDPRFDGLFFTGVITTGIYCRPVCPARAPSEHNVRYFSSAAAAGQAGFRPCLRCRPESAPASAAWAGTDTTLRRAVDLVNGGYLNDHCVPALAARVGVGERYLRKLFQKKLGISPGILAHTQRLHLAQKLLRETSLPVTEVAFAAGFGSLRRFNSATQAAFGCAPSALRRGKRRSGDRGLTLSLGLRPPYDWQGVIALFKRHAVAGLDTVTDSRWERALRTPLGAAAVTVTQGDSDAALTAHIRLSDNRDLMPLLAQLRRIFDLDAHPADIAEDLSQDDMLAPLVQARPGVRSPCFSTAFEAAVRAVLGQQVSTAAARTQCARITEACGTDVAIDGRLWRVFPTPEAFLALPDSELRMPAGRRQTLRSVCELFAQGEPELAALQALKGIGPWTTDLVGMRGLGQPDRFPGSDLGLINAAEALGLSRQGLVARASLWRPWRSYAANLLWRSLGHG
ncbi:MAG: AlkA N-terminal domain-containing protein [Halieaceae bacterium]|jgi:AraC family transcriptional regulator of adaptative response / DNA-3-methyladenine glycosylase II|nr:AlkA N-terminal domain-containing protein [Halieaceae bacterium]